MKNRFLTLIIIVSLVLSLISGCREKSPGGENQNAEEYNNQYSEEDSEEDLYYLINYGGEISGQTYISEFGFSIEFPEGWSLFDRESTAKNLKFSSLEEEIDDYGHLIDALFLVKDDELVLIEYMPRFKEANSTTDIIIMLAAIFEKNHPDGKIQLLETDFGGVSTRFFRGVTPEGEVNYMFSFMKGSIQMVLSYIAQSQDNHFDEFLEYVYKTEK